MNTLICAGGSGLRVLEAVLHLCAAGLGPEKLRILAVDPDGANGNGSKVTALLGKYRDGAKHFRGKLGTDREGQRVQLFGTELDLLDVDGRSEGLKIWSPVRTDEHLRQILGVEMLAAHGVPKDMVSLFFSSEELDMDLDQGFRGRPSVGAAAMSLVNLQADRQPWKQLVEKIRGDLSEASGSRVFLVGSVFGGTGASALYPLAHFLETIPEVNHDRLRVAVGALVPYFRFESGTAAGDVSGMAVAAKADHFSLATRAAVGFYQHLLENDRWPFRSMFWLGDSSPASFPYAPGGPRQKNPGHFVELLTGLTALGFFAQPTAIEGPVYASSRGDADPVRGERSTLAWSDLPLTGFNLDAVRRSLLRFLLTATAHLGFCADLLRRPELARQPYLVPWYWERFIKKKEHLNTQDNREALDYLEEFFAQYHLPWWREVHALETVRLFNRAAFPENGQVGVDRLANLLWPDREGERSPAAFDEFYDEMVRVDRKLGGEHGTAAYLALLANAADRYIDRRYMNRMTEE